MFQRAARRGCAAQVNLACCLWPVGGRANAGEALYSMLTCRRQYEMPPAIFVRPGKALAGICRRPPTGQDSTARFTERAHSPAARPLEPFVSLPAWLQTLQRRCGRNTSRVLANGCAVLPTSRGITQSRHAPAR